MTVTDAPHTPRTDDADLLGVAIVSPSAVVRSGLAQMLAAAPGLEVRYQVDSIAALFAHRRPSEVVVVDLCVHRGDRIGRRFWELLPAGSRSIALCRADDLRDLVAAVQGGAYAFLTRESDVDELRRAVDAVRQRSLYVSAALLEAFVDRPAGRERRQLLGNREIETLQWVAEGLTHGEISRRMGLTKVTVSTYVRRIRTKLNASNKAELTRRAIELGYVTPR